MDKNLGFESHNNQMVSALRQRAGVISRLSLHVPRGEFLRQIAVGLVQGKFQANLANTTHIRLTDGEGSTKVGLQTALNNTARVLTGLKRTSRVRTDVLLQKAGFESANRLAVRAVAMEWRLQKL